jgi:serine/threonine-protein kinase RsbW
LSANNRVQPLLTAAVIEPSMILRVAAELNNLETIRHFVAGCARTLQADQDTALDLAQAADECVTNIIEHGYNGQHGSIEIEINRAGENLTIVLRDHAPLFDPTDVPPPDLTLPLEKREPGGLGIYLARHMVDQMQHRVLSDGGNELTLLKRAKPISSQS